MSKNQPGDVPGLFFLNGSGHGEGFVFFVDDVLETSQVCTFAESLYIG